MAPAAPIDAKAFHDFEYRGWEASVSTYDKYFGPLTQLTIGPLLDAVKVKNGMSVLDVATGPGYVAAAAARRGAAVVGVDFSQKMIDLAKSTNADQQIVFNVGDAEALSYAVDTFDSVAMSFGILHLAEPEKAILEAKRVLRAVECSDSPFGRDQKKQRGSRWCYGRSRSLEIPTRRCPLAPLSSDLVIHLNAREFWSGLYGSYFGESPLGLAAEFSR